MNATKSQQNAHEWIPGPASTLFDYRPEYCIDRKDYMPAGSVERYVGNSVAFAALTHAWIDTEICA